MGENLIWKSAHDLAREYRAGTLSPVDVVEAVIAQLERTEPQLNAFVTTTFDSAREQAREAAGRFAAGGELPRLLGIPITVKDLVMTAGVRTTFGMVAYEQYVPEEDALSWARLKAAGAILIGKTTTPEMGMLGTTESYLTGVTNNPWDITRSPGGSSGGAAASLAAGVAPVAWGSDGGGSIRVPAGLSGVVGFKPSKGRIPHADNPDDSNTDGPLARSVIDVAMMLDVTVGPDLRDRFTIPATGESYTEAALNPRDLTGMRIAASVDLGEDVVDPEVAAQFTAALGRLRAAGAVVDEVEMSLPDPRQYFVSAWGPTYALFSDALVASGEKVWPFIRFVADQSRTLTPIEVSMAFREVRTQIYNAYARLLADYEFILTPTTPTPALTHEEVAASRTLDDPAQHLHRMTESPTHAGLPAVSVPTGFTNAGLPVGLQIIGHPYADADVISFAAAYEQLVDLGGVHPALAV